MTITDRPPPAWQGRHDGDGPEHARWHQVITEWEGQAAPCLIGFASDEGVRRNGGRIGAAEGPAALRAALAPLAARTQPIHDVGDVAVTDGDLESGHTRLTEAVRTVLDAGGLPVVLGGGHEVAYGTGTGLADAASAQGKRIGVINIDAHFDLRTADVPTSGTPFLQLHNDATSAERDFSYAVLGISEANNTQALFDTAADLGVRVLLDRHCSDDQRVRVFVEEFCQSVDLVHLTIDLDALPASVAPGVSAPAGFGISLDAVRLACRLVAESGRMATVEIAELNPTYDIDSRTARTAARLLDEILATNVGRASA